MNVFTNILLYILIIMEYSSFFYVVFGKRTTERKDRNRVLFIITNIVLFFWTIYFKKTEVTIILALSISVINMELIFDLLWLETISLFLIAFPLLTILESVIGYFFNYFLQINSSITSLINTFLVIVLLWIYYFFLGRKIERNAFILKPKMNFVMSLLLFTIVAMFSYFTYALTEVIHMKKGLVGLGLVMIGGVVIFVAFLSIIYYFNVQQKYHLENEILEKYNKQQKRHFEMLLEKEQKTRQFRHDIISELMQIKNFSIKKDYEGLEKYVTDALEEIASISKYDYDVGNETVNVILNYYLLPVRSKCKIEVSGYISDSFNISDRDICIIVSNLIVNAIEAVENVENPDKYISFTIKSGKMYTFIIVKNMFMEKQENQVDENITTTKADKKNHGFGIKNVKNVVEKYNGEFIYKKENNQFVAEIRIKNNRLSNK